jgi:tRNA (cmo5U34)-methyltransferase
VEEIAPKARFDAATMLLVLHLLETEAERRALLAETAKRLVPGAPLLIALPCTSLDDDDLFVKAWRKRLASQGVAAVDIEQHLDVVMARTAVTSKAQVRALLAETGFTKPRQYFASLFFRAWLTHRASPR